jgi:hypothetical protein
MESCSKQVLNKSKYILYLRFFKVAALYQKHSTLHPTAGLVLKLWRVGPGRVLFFGWDVKWVS